MEQPARPRTAKVVLIGDSGTGKSALHQRYMTNTFSREYTATLGCSYQAKTIEIDGVQLTLQLWDTAGQERFRSLAASFFRGADGCILACSSTDPASVEALAGHFAQFTDRGALDPARLTSFCWAAVECKADLESLIQPRRLGRVLGGLVPVPGGAGATPLSRANSRTGSPELSRKISSKRKLIGMDSLALGGSSASGTPRLATTPPNPAGGLPSTPPEPTTSLISVAHPFSPPSKQQNSSMHSLHSQASFASTFGTAHTGDISNISIYHTPSSSLHHHSTDSLSGSDHTITPGTGTPSINSDEDPYAEQAEEELTLDARRQSAKFGIDPFLSSSPPHPPPHLGRLPDPKLIYSGGPATVPFDVDAPPTPPEAATPGECHDCPGDGPGAAGLEHDYAFDGVPLFRTSAKTGDGVDELFEYVARRVLWKWRQEAAEEAASGDGVGRGQEVIRVGGDGKEKAGKGWRGACCA